MGRAVTEIDIRQPREGLISHLDRLLEQAKSGELTGIIAVSLWQGGGVGHGWSMNNGEYLRTMIGEMEMLKHNLIDNENSIND